MSVKTDTVVLYVHGKGGNASEAEHYRALFPQADVVGFDYKAANPWEAKEEFSREIAALKADYTHILLVAGSIGAYFCMQAEISASICKAYFISPIVNLERLILDMMTWAGVTEKVLEEKKIIPTAFGEDLSWDYLQYVRRHPIVWEAPTEILYGSTDSLQSLDTIRTFA